MKSIKKLGIALALIAPCILAASAVPAFEIPVEAKLEDQEPILASYRIDAPRSTCAIEIGGRAAAAGTTEEGKDAVAPARHPCSDEAKEIAAFWITLRCDGPYGWGSFWCDERGRLRGADIECGTRPPDGKVAPR